MHLAGEMPPWTQAGAGWHTPPRTRSDTAWTITVATAAAAVLAVIGVAIWRGLSAAPNNGLGASGSPFSPVTGSAPSGMIYLAELPAYDTTFENQDRHPTLGGAPQYFSITADVGQRHDKCGVTSGYAMYDLGGGYTTFAALIGVDDKSADKSLAPIVEVSGDGRVLSRFAPTLGAPARASVDVVGVQILEIAWSAPHAPCTINYLVIGNPALLPLGEPSAGDTGA